MAFSTDITRPFPRWRNACTPRGSTRCTPHLTAATPAQNLISEQIRICPDLCHFYALVVCLKWQTHPYLKRCKPTVPREVLSCSHARLRGRMCYCNEYGCVISELVISYISWELITPVVRSITVQASLPMMASTSRAIRISVEVGACPAQAWSTKVCQLPWIL